LLLIATDIARATTWTWTGTGGNINWSTIGNWNALSAPPSSSTTDLSFAGSTNSGTALIPLNQNIANPFHLNNLNFATGSGSFFLGGNPLAFTGATTTISQDSNNAQRIANKISASNNSTVTLTLTGSGPGIVTLSGSIDSGSGNRDYAITKTGTSSFTLSGNNTYGGATAVNAGVLNIQHANALGSTASGTSVASGAALQIQGGIALGTEALTLNGSGIASDGAFRNISGNNSFAGAITLGSASNLASDSGALTLSGNVNNGGFLLTESGAGNVTITSVISGTGGLTKTGAGTLTLSGAASNTYTGPTTVNQGTLILAKPGSVAAPAITIGGAGASATVQLNGAFQLYGAATTINSGGLLNLNNFNEYVTTLTVSGGSLTTGTGSLYIGGTLTSNANSVSSTMTGNYILYGNQTFNVASGTTPSGQDLVISGPVSEYNVGTTFTKSGAGTLVLSGANSFTGLTTISAGALNIQNGSALGTTAGGTSITSGAALQLQGGIAVGNEALTINGSGIASTGALRNISGNNSFAGGITSASASTVSSDAGTLTLTGGIVNGGFATTFTGAGNISESGVISGTGPLVKNGTGTMTLTGANSYSGATTINAGTLIVAAGSGSALGSSSGVTVNSGGTLLLGASNGINNNVPVTLSGGTFAKGNFSEGSATGWGVGALTLTSTNSHIDFGNGTVGTLTFASFAPGSNSLTIDNWTGTAGVAGGATTDRLIFASNQSANLSSFIFTGYSGAMEFDLGNGYYEITPVAAVPEPSTWITAALALAAISFRQVRRRHARAKRT
jgi:autotransporter-associated beta strand protein